MYVSTMYMYNMTISKLFNLMVQDVEKGDSISDQIPVKALKTFFKTLNAQL